MPYVKSMTITSETLKKVAQLSKLEVDDAQIASLKKDMDAILDMVEEVCNVDTQNIDVLSHPLESQQPLREDVCKENEIKKEVQSLSEHIENDLYIVPKVID